ncbi:hypothetical protein [Nostoc sp. FACHB-888]|uniref:hypothetical protein n=1 Tax=Nostoc sp. FACHB-888 TaxID=2692842 RepID=UPI001683B5D9|nr:hypothetical protein [Nostoc sp. FACHB-888]MBD2248543.1 hypothetical protein [Nostoc sp. FACHB-888]
MLQSRQFLKFGFSLPQIKLFWVTRMVSLGISSKVVENSTNPLVLTLFTELRSLIADLGKNGGLISPSVYDTAQVLRFYPPATGVEPALEWLLTQQQADGGWGNPRISHHNSQSLIKSGFQCFTQHQKITCQKCPKYILGKDYEECSRDL